MIGRVVSTKSEQTAVVIIERIVKHPLYNKSFVRTKKYTVHDTLGVKMGDLVNIEKCRPVSKNKHWKITKVVGQDLVEINEQQLKEKAEEVIAEVMPEDEVVEQSVSEPTTTKVEPSVKKKVTKRKEKTA